MGFSTPAGRRTPKTSALAGTPLTLCLSSGCNMVGDERGAWACTVGIEKDGCRYTVGRVGDSSRRSKSAGPSSLEPSPSSGRLGRSTSGVPAPTSGGDGMGTWGVEGIGKVVGDLTRVMLWGVGARAGGGFGLATLLESARSQGAVASNLWYLRGVGALMRWVAGDTAGGEPVTKGSERGGAWVAVVRLPKVRIRLPFKSTPSGCKAPAAIHIHAQMSLLAQNAGSRSLH